MSCGSGRCAPRLEAQELLDTKSSDEIGQAGLRGVSRRSWSDRQDFAWDVWIRRWMVCVFTLPLKDSGFGVHFVVKAFQVDG